MGFTKLFQSPGTLVRSYRTVAPLPVAHQQADGPSAVSFLWHFPASRLDWGLPSILSCGVRTFLGTANLSCRSNLGPVTRPPGQLTTGRSLARSVLFISISEYGVRKPSRRMALIDMRSRPPVSRWRLHLGVRSAKAIAQNGPHRYAFAPDEPRCGHEVEDPNHEAAAFFGAAR